MPKMWQHFSHGADIGVRGTGSTLEEAFQMAAVALTEVISPIETIKPLIDIPIFCKAPDKEILFLDWLNAIIYEMATRKMLFSEFEIKISELNLYATVKGEMIDATKHQPAVEIKGATFTELKVEQENSFWIAQCVLDV